MTGRPQLIIVNEKNVIGQATQAYNGMMGSLASEGKISNDAELIKRIQRITDRLISQAVLYRPDVAGWSWSVNVIDDPKTLNAFCMPGGKMAIYTGLITRLSASDDEIAAVMGHEISHAIANHGAERQSLLIATNFGAIAAAAATTSAGGANSNQNYNINRDAATLAALAFVNLPNSRETEEEADRLGIELAARAGFHPHAAVTMWEKMIAETKRNGRFDFFSTHPSSPKRIDSLTALEPPMLKLYEAAPKEDADVTPWTTTSPGERLEVVASQHSIPLLFYSPEAEKFKAGEAELTGSQLSPFLLKQNTLKDYHDRQAWRELMREIMTINFRFDLCYYYLGKAAEGLGFKEAAQRYFATALDLATKKDTACANGFLATCAGIDIVRDAHVTSAVHEPAAEQKAAPNVANKIDNKRLSNKSEMSDTTSTGSDDFHKLERLKILRDREVITQEEFERKKKEILDRM